MNDIRVSDLAHSVDTAEEYFLAHYGVMGMKWGVRRYQNEDGTLTEKGKNRFKKVSENEHLQKRDQKNAIRNVKRTKFAVKPDNQANYYNKKAEKARAKGDTEKMKKYISTAKAFTKMSVALNKRLDDFQSETLKAGRDFIIQRDYDLWLLGPIMALTRTDTVIEK